MKVIDILKQRHTVIMTMNGYNEHQGLVDYTQKDLTMYEILFPLANKFKETVELLRQQEYHSDNYNYIKNNMLPVWYVGGTFPKAEIKDGKLVTYLEDKDLQTYSNILSIDIDNQEIDRQAIFDLPYVFAVLKSSGGVGYYVLILVEDGKYTKEYYSYLAKMFKSRFSVKVDKQCTNIGRKRVLSYEDNIEKWVKPDNAEIVPWKLKDIEVKFDLFNNPVRMIDYRPVKVNNDISVLTRKAIWKLLDSGFSVDNYSGQSENYGAWYHTACEFANFEDGYDMFVKFSQNSTKYNDDINTINKKWKNADKNKTNIDDVNRKWCGMCKNRFGNKWWKSS